MPSTTPFAMQIALLKVAIAVVLLSAAGQTLGPAQATSRPNAAPPTKSVPPPDARVDINRASIDELLKIPGMTPVWANRIIRFRPYRTREDLIAHGVLPANVYERVKDYVIAHREK